MATNDRIQYDIKDISHNQLAPSQANRTQFTPGKSVSRAEDQNWPKENKIPTGTPAFDGESAGPIDMTRVRVVKLGRNIISDQTVPVPVVLDTRVETRVEEGISGSNTTQDTQLPVRPTEYERNAGHDQVVGA